MRVELSEAQEAAISKWWEENDPNGWRFDCVDNVRVAIKGNSAQEAYYNELANGGCCGFVDVEIEVGDGTTILYGFNYGH